MVAAEFDFVEDARVSYSWPGHYSENLFYLEGCIGIISKWLLQ